MPDGSPRGDFYRKQLLFSFKKNKQSAYSTGVAGNIIKIKHRHMAFTIPEDQQRAKQKANRRMEREKERAILDFVRYKCLECGLEENIPEEIVMQMDFEDGGDPTCPPRFKCEACPGQMDSICYEGVYGYTYRFGENSY